MYDVARYKLQVLSLRLRQADWLTSKVATQQASAICATCSRSELWTH